MRSGQMRRWATKQFFLDLLDTLPHEMHGVVLTCLIELTENPKTMSHFMTWRSSKVEVGQPPVTLAGLLIKLWKDEEKRIGCQRGPRGELSNICYPMAGTSQIQGTIICSLENDTKLSHFSNKRSKTAKSCTE